MSAAHRAPVRTPYVVVVGVDLSRSSERAVEWVATHATKVDDWVLLFVHVVAHARSSPGGELYDAVLSLGEHFDALTDLHGAGRIRFRRVVAESVVEGLLTFATSASADLVVIGESQRSIFATVADRVARGAHCPVVIVRNSRNAKS